MQFNSDINNFTKSKLVNYICIVFTKGKKVIHNPNAGVLVQSNSLVLQKVKREAKGNYQCIVTNEVATVTSNVTQLNIICK